MYYTTGFILHECLFALCVSRIDMSLQWPEYVVKMASTSRWRLCSKSSPMQSGKGLQRSSWIGKEVVLLDTSGKVCGNGFVQFVGAHQCINGRTELGQDRVGVVLYNVEPGKPYKLHSLQEWSTSLAFLNSISLHDHECAHLKNVESQPAKIGKRAYSSNRKAKPKVDTKIDKLLSNREVARTLSQTCCDRKCLSQFGRCTVKMLRYEMHTSKHEKKMAFKLAVHRNYHYCRLSGRKLVVVEGQEVCMRAWRLLYGVAESTFYAYRKMAQSGVRPQEHKAKGVSRVTNSTKQAVEMMRLLLEQQADSMPHRSRTLPTGEKVVEKVLPTGTKWKKIIADVNKV